MEKPCQLPFKTIHSKAFLKTAVSAILSLTGSWFTESTGMNSASFAPAHTQICLVDVHVIGGTIRVAKSKTEIVDMLRKYLKDVEGVCHVDKAIVFGSWAKGKAGEYSDIDMAIFSRSVSDENRLEVMARIIALITKYKMDIQPVVFPYVDNFHEENDFICNKDRKNGF
jgi:predicted nucleotidyltransferase